MAVFPLLALPPEERLAFELVASSELVPPESGMRSSISLRESTAADRAAADMRRLGMKKRQRWLLFFRVDTVKEDDLGSLGSGNCQP